MKFPKLFKREEPQLMTPETDINGGSRFGCSFCRAVKTAGRSGEKELAYDDGTIATIEIINEKKVEGRGKYTLNISNDIEVGWADCPIKFCPFCGAKLGGTK